VRERKYTDSPRKGKVGRISRHQRKKKRKKPKRPYLGVTVIPYHTIYGRVARKTHTVHHQPSKYWREDGPWSREEASDMTTPWFRDFFPVMCMVHLCHDHPSIIMIIFMMIMFVLTSPVLIPSDWRSVSTCVDKLTNKASPCENIL